ncbi:gametocyte-specific factor 1-like isoform X2 [Solea senegalensis]|uniref:Gametocyte-specific factor 1-like isoform X2 n=1 Tax=Solea senegalensis TaxID=28829 RepID=A0AAV6SPX4_SOLSE|nr:gametocyte-specific factor 1 [Solea senegalensis]KAG7519169.1 gametocyte-specific factor 1-like isoform X2 [Solea senegalensis]
MANTLTYGSSIGACRVASSERAQLAEEHDSKGNHDPERLIQCPFDKNHQIRSCRFPYHLIKCKKNHPELARELKTCPFNARHLVPKHELPHHTETCEDRVVVDSEDGGNSNGRNKWHVPVSTWVNPDMSEDWDKEADDNASAFVWGETKALHVRQETRLTDNLGPSFRAPNTLPWS